MIIMRGKSIFAMYTDMHVCAYKKSKYERSA